MRQLSPAVLPDLDAPDRLPLQSSEAERRARDIVDGAAEEARRLMEGAQQKAAALLEAARREGALQGQAEAFAAGQAAVADAVQVLTRAAGSVQRLEAEGRVGREAVIIELALRLAERILHQAISDDPARLVPVVNAAIAGLACPGPVVVRVHPVVASVLAAQPPRKDALGPVSVVPDPSLPPDGCVVEGGATTIEGGIAAQLAEAGRRMREEPW